MYTIIFSFSPKAELGSQALEDKLIEVRDTKVSEEEISGRKFVLFEVDKFPTNLVKGMHQVYNDNKRVMMYSDKGLASLLESKEGNELTDFTVVVAEVDKSAKFINNFVVDMRVYIKEITEFSLSNLVSLNNWLRGIYKLNKISILAYIFHPSLIRRKYVVRKG